MRNKNTGKNKINQKTEKIPQFAENLIHFIISSKLENAEIRKRHGASERNKEMFRSIA